LGAVLHEKLVTELSLFSTVTSALHLFFDQAFTALLEPQKIKVVMDWSDNLSHY
jgi:hypothetical protein